MEMITRINEAFGALDQMETESQAIIGLHSQFKALTTNRAQNYTSVSRRRNRNKRN